jgi:hypothetical protein
LQWIEFFLFAGLLFIFTILLALVASKYTYADYTEGDMATDYSEGEA